MDESLELAGKVVVVTGGGTGLGREMALALAGAGADLAVVGRRPKPLEDVARDAADLGRRALAVPADVTDPDRVGSMFSDVLDGLGRVDVLVNNAGMVTAHGGAPIWEIPVEEFRAGLESNLTSAFLCSRGIAEHMVERGGGKIINVSSGFGLRGGRDNYAYACAKGGVIQLTRTLATSLGRYGVTSNCIVPGYFPTEATEASHEVLPRPDFIPVGRVGDPKELGPIAVFLASAASDYMNGALFVADGGGLAGGYAPTGYAPVVPLES
jgi:NAD(P)-dependent dehydrogenase (short-subunit alcohol dehydrogenase family)